MPIYYVIGTYVHNAQMFGVYRILNCFETTLEQLSDYHPVLEKYSAQGIIVSTFMFEREPANPFHAAAAKEGTTR